MAKTKRKHLASLASRKRKVYKIHVDSKPEFKTTVQDMKEDVHVQGLKRTDLAEQTSRIFMSYRRRKYKNTGSKANRIETHQSSSTQALHSNGNGKSQDHDNHHKGVIDDDDVSSWVEVRKQRVIIIIPALPKALPKHSISKQEVVNVSKDVTRCKIPRKHTNVRSRLLKPVPETADLTEVQKAANINQLNSAKPNIIRSKGKRLASNRDKELPSKSEHHMSGMDILVASALGTEPENCQGKIAKMVKRIPEDQSLDTADSSIRRERLYSRLKQDTELKTTRYRRLHGNASQKRAASDNQLGTEKVCDRSLSEKVSSRSAAEEVSDRPRPVKVRLMRLPEKFSDKSQQVKIRNNSHQEKGGDKSHLEKVSDKSHSDKVVNRYRSEETHLKSDTEKVTERHPMKIRFKCHPGKLYEKSHSEKVREKSHSEKVTEKSQPENVCKKSYSDNICKKSPNINKVMVEQQFVSEDVKMHDNTTPVHSMNKKENTSSTRIYLSPDLTANQAFRVSTLKRQLDRAGGIVEWLCLVGLHQFKDVFEERTWNEAELLQLNMDDLKNMGKPAVGPRRKFLWAINHLSQQLI